MYEGHSDEYGKNRNMKQPAITLCLGTVKNTVIWYGVGLSQQVKEKRSGLLSSGVSSAWRRPASCSPSYRETDLGFKTGGVTPSAVFTAFGTQWLSPFWPLQGYLRGRHFRSDGEVKGAVHYRLTQRPKDFFCRGIYALVGRRRRRVERGGDDIENWCRCTVSVFAANRFI